MVHPQDRYTKPQISEQQTREDDCDLEHLVGKSNDATIGIEGISRSALLDTGSSVSTVSQDFYPRCLSHLDLHQIDQLLKTECADGQPLPYLGSIKVDIAIPGISKSTLQPCLLLVVPQITALQPLDYLAPTSCHPCWRPVASSLAPDVCRPSHTCHRGTWPCAAFLFTRNSSHDAEPNRCGKVSRTQPSHHQDKRSSSGERFHR